MTYDSDPLDPNGTFAVNTWGRLAEVSWGACTSGAASRSYTEEYSYDVAGDVIGKRLSILKGGHCWKFSVCDKEFYPTSADAV
jgi:hypothetical protein